jgi:hypothetical protein
MTIYPHEAFVYLWHHGPTKTYYLGFHRGTPDDGYAHSSGVLPVWDANNPPPGWRRRILAYGTRHEMYELEGILLKKRKHHFTIRYHNKAVWGGKYPFIEKLSEEHKRKIGKSLSGENNPNYGGLKEQTKQKIKESMQGTRVGEDNPMYGKSQKESTRNKIAAKARERKRGWVTEPDGTTHLIDPTTFVLPEGWIRGRGKYTPVNKGKSRTIRHDLVTPPLIGL